MGIIAMKVMLPRVSPIATVIIISRSENPRCRFDFIYRSSRNGGAGLRKRPLPFQERQDGGGSYPPEIARRARSFIASLHIVGTGCDPVKAPRVNSNTLTFCDEGRLLRSLADLRELTRLGSCARPRDRDS